MNAPFRVIEGSAATPVAPPRRLALPYRIRESLMALARIMAETEAEKIVGKEE